MQTNNFSNGSIHAILLVFICTALSACQTVMQTDTATKDAEQILFEQANTSLSPGDTDLAIEQVQQLIKQNPAADQAYTNLGLLLLTKDDNVSAQQAFLNAIEQDENDAIAYNHLAVIQRQQGLFQQALLNYETAIRINPEYAKAHLNLGILYDIYLQQFPKAIRQYERYQELTGNSNTDVEKWLVDIKRRLDEQQEKSK